MSYLCSRSSASRAGVSPTVGRRGTGGGTTSIGVFSAPQGRRSLTSVGRK